MVIINETAARRFWPNESAIGKRLGRPGDNPNWLEVVGVVNDVNFPGDLGEPYTRLESFRPLAQTPWGTSNIALRASSSIGTPEALTNDLRRAIADIDPALLDHKGITGTADRHPR